jgi:GNAT superfamily N-acetyltransferase
MALEWRRGDFVVSDDPERLNPATIHRFIAGESYWAPGIPEGTLARAMANSLCFGMYRAGDQVGFARAVTDRATFAYLCDVFVDAAHRGAGLGRWMVECVLAHPDLQGLRRIALVTRDAHGLYRPFGFKPMPDPARYMELTIANPYRNAREGP